MASQIYGIPPERVNADQRQLGKQAVLGCGFSMGSEKFKATCWAKAQLRISDELAQQAVKAYRMGYSKVADNWIEGTKHLGLWGQLENAAKGATLTPGQKFTVGFCSFEGRTVSGLPYLLATLPSRRVIAYPHPKIELLEGDTQEGLTYYGSLPGTPKWGRIKLYGGKISENLTMGVEADLMAHGAVTAERRGFTIWGLIHDQALGRAQGKLDDFVAALTDLPPWATGLPLKAEGKICNWYRK